MRFIIAIALLSILLLLALSLFPVNSAKVSPQKEGGALDCHYVSLPLQRTIVCQKIYVLAVFVQIMKERNLIQRLSFL